MFINELMLESNRSKNIGVPATSRRNAEALESHMKKMLQEGGMEDDADLVMCTTGKSDTELKARLSRNPKDTWIKYRVFIFTSWSDITGPRFPPRAQRAQSLMRMRDKGPDKVPSSNYCTLELATCS